ncbi:MAG: FG-GAP-like repeat-containing protein [Planctomycetota bacterium]|nr:FG-GAP-like repeat-containing protein [Planctomycetota bacterium]
MYFSGGNATLANSTIADNTATLGGGGIFSYGTLTIAGSTIAGNRTEFGGGIYNGGTLALTNSTVSGNQGGRAGGLENVGGGSVRFINTTITNNVSTQDGSGIYNAGNPIEIGNTILAANVGGTSPDFSGSFTSLGHNLIGKASGSTFVNGVNGDLVGTVASPLNPQLGPLQDNGGLTQTLAPLRGSPAIDAGTNTGAPATDQRGALRIVDGNGDGTATADIGAVEFGFLVNTTEDTVDANPGDGLARDATGKTSLRAAIMEANASAGQDVIFLPAGTYVSTLAGAYEDAGATGDLDIRDSLIIVGAGRASTMVDGNSLDRVFHVRPTVSLTLSGLTITRGTAGGTSSGGAVYNERGWVSITDCTLSGNSATSNGTASGGAIYNDRGWLSLTNSTLSGNAGYAYGGGFSNGDGTVFVTDTAFVSNVVTQVSGGGFANVGSGTATLVRTTFTGNSADDSAGAMYIGGGIVTLADSVFSSNYSYYQGGAIQADAGTVSITGSTFSNNGSSGRSGGALAIGAGAAFTVDRSVFSGNTADDYAGAIYNGGSATITRSTFSGNSAAFDGGVLYTDAGTTSISNSTLSGNSASCAGAVANAGGTIEIVSSTIVGNSATWSPAGIINYSGELQLKNSIAAASLGGKADLQGEIVSQGHNFIGNVGVATGLTHGVLGDLVGTAGTPLDPKLGSLQDNGGPTQTRAPLVGSPAIDAGDDAGVATADQRGFPRSLDGNRDGVRRTDIGAVEYVDPNFLVVDSFVDTVDACLGDGAGADANGKHTLRAAIMETNAHAGPDTIVLAAGTYALSIPGTFEDAAATGDLDVTGELTILGAGADLTSIDARQLDRVFEVRPNAKLTLSGLTVTGGRVEPSLQTGSGGGILNFGNLTVNRAVIANNLAQNGGGIANYETAPLTLVDSTLLQNTATDYGGGISGGAGTTSIRGSTFTGNSAYAGGGIAAMHGTIQTSTFSNNTAEGGGGIWIQDGTLTITSSTFTGNTARNGAAIEAAWGGSFTLNRSTLSGNRANAGAISIEDGSNAWIVDCTVVGNSSATDSGSGILVSGGRPSPVYLGNTIVAGNGQLGTAVDVTGEIHSLGHNFIGAGDNTTGFTTGVNGDQVGTAASPRDAQLGPLQDNGGPTWTHAPLAGSPVVDAGRSTAATDQLGLPRSLDGNQDGTATADIGAVEYLDPSFFFVDSFLDTIDANPGDGIVADANGRHTLRAAIMEANAQAGADTIVLAVGTYDLSLPGSGEDLAATGDLDIRQNLTMIGSGADVAILDAHQLDRVFDVQSGVTLQLTGVTVTGGKADTGGGLLVRGNSGLATLTDTVVTGNQATTQAGGLRCLSYARINVVRSTVTGNTAPTVGGMTVDGSATIDLQDSLVSGNVATGDTGGIRVDGNLTVSGSTIANNRANQWGGMAVGGTLTMVNSTVSGNVGQSASGGITAHGTATVTITNSTITGNHTVGTWVGGILNEGTFYIQNSIIAGNWSASGRDIAGARGFISLGHNLIGDGSGSSGFTNGVNGDVVGINGSPVDPLLGPLADNGGTTLTHLPLPGSPVIDAGNNTGAPATDQTGIARPQDGNGDSTATVDIGAVERYWAEIHGRLFHDHNRDGSQAGDGSEPGWADWTVYLDWNQNGTLDRGEPSSVTNASGDYAFTGLAPGSYRVAEVSQAGWESLPALSSSLYAGQVLTGINFANHFFNHAPVLADTNLDVLLPLTSTASLDRGTLVSNLVGGVTDVDAGDLRGVAITAVDSTHGTLQYSLDDGGTWTNVGTVSNASALLLAADANTRLRYRRSDGPSTTLANVLTFRAWDRAESSSGQRVSTTTNGLDTAFSAATDTVTATFTSYFWDGEAGDGLWSSAANWNSDAVPPSGANVLIDVPGEVVVTHGTGSRTVQRLQAEESLVVSGVGTSLTVTGLAVFRGALTVDAAATLTASGTTASVAALGPTNLQLANLYATNAGRLNLPNAASYRGTAGQAFTISADGAGSLVDLSGVTALTGSSSVGSCGGVCLVKIEAKNGGRVDLSATTSLTNQVSLSVGGPTDEIVLSAVTAITGSDSTLRASGGGRLSLPKIETLTGVYLLATGSSLIDVSHATSYAGTYGRIHTISADGSGSLVDLSGVTTLVGGTNVGSCGGPCLVKVETSNSGRVDLSSTTSTTNQVSLSVAGPTDQIDVSALTAITGNDSTLRASGGGRLELPQIQTLTGVFLLATGGGVVDVSQATTYAGTPGRNYTVSATGAGSLVDLSGLTTLSGSTGSSCGGPCFAGLEAGSGGRLDLTALPALTNAASTVALTVHGGGQVDFGAGATTIDGVHVQVEADGILAAAQLNLVGAGLLTGTGQVRAAVSNAATFAPGTSPGVLTIDGDYTQTTTGQLNIEVGGLAAGTQYDQLRVTGRATLGGTLNVTASGGFTPSFGQTFQPLTFAAHTGEFGQTTLSGMPAGLGFQPSYNASNVSLMAAMVVNSTADSVDANPGDGIAADALGRTTLRAAIMEANARPGPDMILLGAGTYDLSIPGASEDAAATGDLDITSDLTIIGAGADVTIVDANQLDRVFDVQSGAPLTLSHVTVTGGHVETLAPGEGYDYRLLSSGGGVRSLGDIEIDHAVIADNEAYYGGGIFNDEGKLLVVADSTIMNNRADERGGGVYNRGTATVTNSVLSLNTAVGAGGALFGGNTTTIRRSTFTGNSATAGGAIAETNGTIEDSTFSANTASADGGAIGLSGVTLTISRSLFTGNIAHRAAGAIDQNGPGILTIVGSTISGNQALGEWAGGLLVANGATAIVENSTIVNNTANFPAGAGIYAFHNPAPQAVRLSNTIVAGNVADSGFTDVGGIFESLGHNLIGKSDGSTGFVQGVNGDQLGTIISPLDPRLGPLQDNGGPTQTHKPLPGSPVIDAGDNTGVAATDQRGAPRILDGNSDRAATVDIGAVEYFDSSYFFVDSFEDTVDANPGDGIVADVNGHRTLRAAIMEANALAGAQTIILAAGMYELALAGAGEDAAATGDLDVTDTTGTLTILGPGSDLTTIDAQQLDRVFQVTFEASLHLVGVTITGGDSSAGGGVYSSGRVVMEQCLVKGNHAASVSESVHGGGGIFNWHTANLTVISSQISNNTADYGGGINGSGIVTLDRAEITANVATRADGGGLYGQGSWTINSSTITGNRAARSGGGLAANSGDGSWIIRQSTIADNQAGSAGGGVEAAQPIAISDSTISGNDAGADGGGLSVSNATFVTNTTITGNSASGLGKGVFNHGELRLQNTIVAANVGGNDLEGNGTSVSLGHNLIGAAPDSSGFAPGVNGDQVGTSLSPLDPQLGPLQNNGGATLSHVPLPGSPVIDAGDNALAGAIDQLGTARPQDGNGDGTATVDIGAVERYYGEIHGRVFHDLDQDGRGSFAAVDFEDNFNAGASPLWENGIGNWQASGGVYFAQDFGTSPLTYSSLPFDLKDFSVTVEIQDIADGGIWLRGSDNGNNGVLLVTCGGFSGYTGLDWAVRGNGYGDYGFNPVAGLFVPGQTDVRIRIDVVGDTYAAFLNDDTTPVSTFTTSAVSHGRVGLYDNSKPGERFDRVRVTANEFQQLGLAGRTVFLDANDNGRLDGGETSTVTDAGGNYRFATLVPGDYLVRQVLPPGWEQTLPPGQAGKQVVNLYPGQVAVDQDFGEGVTLAIDDLTLTSEWDAGASPYTFTVNLSAASPQPVTVQYTTVAGTATAGLDYQTTTGTLTFHPGQTSQTVTVSVLGDVLNEDNETFSLVLSNASGARITKTQGIGTIVDDDPLPKLTINDATLAVEGDVGNTNVEFTITLSPVSGREVWVDYSTQSNTATSGVDFVSVGGTLHFAAGETTKTVVVPVVGDFEHEPTETFFVNLSNPVNANLQDGQGQGTLTDDDPLLTVNSTADKIDLTPGNGLVNTGAANEITLRAAIMEANALAGPDAIVLPAGTYKLTIAGTNEDAAAKGDLDIAPGGLTITGAGAATTVIDAASLDRVFDVHPGATLTLIGVTIQGGRATGTTENGGGIENQGSLVLIDCVVDTNTAVGVGVGGGIDNRDSLTVTRSRLSNNTADQGGAIHNLAGAVLTITDSVLQGNTAQLFGGAIIADGTLDIIRTTFQANHAVFGGAILNGGELTVTDSSFVDNHASGQGGAIFTAADPGTPLNVIGSSFIHNLADLDGGALYLSTEGEVTVVNSTLTQNTAVLNGGAIYNELGALTLTHVTIAGNAATGLGGGVFNGASAQVLNTIVALNTATQSDPDVSGPFTSLGHNLIGRRGSAAGFVHGSNGDQVGTVAAPLDPLLRALEDNGGPTLTMGLQPGSPALDRGSDPDAITLDQRGYRRPEDGDLVGAAVSDIGAFELTYNQPPVIPDQDFLVNENVALGTFVGTVQFSGPEADDTVTLALLAGNTGGTFALDSLTGRLTVTAPLNHETLDSYVLTIRGEDRGHRQTTATIRIHVADLNEPPVLIGSGIDDRMRSDGAATETVSLSSVFFDPDAGDSLTYTASSSNSQLVEAVVQAGGTLELTYHSYTAIQDRTPAVITVTATDQGGLSISDTSLVTVTPSKTLEYVLVVVAQPTPQIEVTTLPTSLSSVATGSTYYVEIWLRDLFVLGLTSLPPSTYSKGVLQGAIDVTYQSGLSTGVRLDHNGIFVYNPSFTGSIDQNSGIVENFGGKSLTATEGVTPDYGRLGFIEFTATSQGQQIFGLHLDAQVTQTQRTATAPAGGKLNPNQLRLAAPLVVAIVPEGGSVPFAPVVSFPAGSNPTALVLADLDGDGDQDLGVANGSANQVSLLWNTPGFSQVVQLSDGEVATAVNFGDRAAPGQIRGRVFQDVNRNGLRESFEPGLPAAVVYLDLNQNGQLDVGEPSRTTDATGLYAFTNLSALTTYRVAEVVPSGGTLSAPAGDGRYQIALGPGEVRTDVDFGNTFEGGVSGNSITGTLFRDTNGNGKRDPGESGLANITVFLDVNGNGQLDVDEPTAVTRTDAPGTPNVDESGTYEFPSLGAGTYQLRIVAQADLRQTYPLGNSFTTTELRADGGPRALAVSDFNRDGRSDLAVANSVSNTVSILTNRGPAGFATTATIAVGLGASAVVTADLNGDLWPDLAITNAYGSSVSVLLNREDGSFGPAQSFATGIGPSSIAAGDFDHDGDLDLAIANDASNSVTVLFNDGHGSFPTRRTYTTDDSPVAIVAVDLNGDNYADLAAANIDSDNVTLLINDQHGGFVAAANLPVGDAPFALAAADLNADGKLDLAVANVLSDNISILLNQGDGWFAAAKNYSGGKGPSSLAAADMDADGAVDLVVTNGNAGNLSVLRNKGDGTFSDPTNFGQANFPTSLPLAVIAADIDHNGTIDLAVANGDSDNVSVLTNTLVAGTQTVVLSGMNSVSSINFGVQEINTPPTNITLSANTVAENAAGAALGHVTVADPNAGDTHTLTVSDVRFEIVVGQLKLKAGQSLDFETAASVSLNITAIDAGGLNLTKAFTVLVTNVNEAPTNIGLSANTVAENAPGAAIGHVTVSDPDTGDTHTLTVSDSRFEIVVGQLKL